MVSVSLLGSGDLCVSVRVCACECVLHLVTASPASVAPESVLVQLAFHQRPVRNPQATGK